MTRTFYRILEHSIECSGYRMYTEFLLTLPLTLLLTLLRLKRHGHVTSLKRTPRGLHTSGYSRMEQERKSHLHFHCDVMQVRVGENIPCLSPSLSLTHRQQKIGAEK